MMTEQGTRAAMFAVLVIALALVVGAGVARGGWNLVDALHARLVAATEPAR